jgi:hypothetical protein
MKDFAQRVSENAALHAVNGGITQRITGAKIVLRNAFSGSHQQLRGPRKRICQNYILADKLRGLWKSAVPHIWQYQ